MIVEYEDGRMKVTHESGVVDYYTITDLQIIQIEQQTIIERSDKYITELISRINSCQLSTAPP